MEIGGPGGPGTFLNSTTAKRPWLFRSLLASASAPFCMPPSFQVVKHRGHEDEIQAVARQGKGLAHIGKYGPDIL